MKIELKNSIACASCESKIPAYVDTCPECGAFVRNRVNNLNIWKTILGLFDSPVNTTTQIVFAKRKSGIVFIAFAFVLVLSFYDLVFHNFISNTVGGIAAYGSILRKSLFFYFLSISIAALLTKFLFLPLGYKVRVKDIFAILIYSFSPIILTTFFLFPIEIGLFGEFWFSFHPFPWVIKPFPAYMLISIHGIMLFWSFILLFIGMKKIMKNISAAFISSVFLLSLLFAGQYFSIN